jgi:hypothetical protein
MRERDGGELRCAQRLRHSEFVGARHCRPRGARRCRRPAQKQGDGQDDEPSDASMNIAVRQSYSEISARASGATSSDPMAKPAETSATARLRCSVNQRVVVAIIGA